jgi:uncharacterized protein (TIGR00251 family)
LSDGPLSPARDGVFVAIRLAPRARADRLLGVAAAAGGGRVLKAAVTAPPEAGRANTALLRLLSDAWHLPRRDLSIASGAASRSKRVLVAGDPQLLLPRLTAAIDRLPAE